MFQKHQIETRDSIPQLRASYVSHLEDLQEQRNELKIIKKEAIKETTTPAHIMSLDKRIGDLSEEIKKVRHMIKLCDDCFIDSIRIAENDKLPDINPKFIKQQKTRSGMAR